MSDRPSQHQENQEFHRTVKEFGNGAHVTVPSELIGEEVLIQHATESESGLSTPIDGESLRELFAEHNFADEFTFEPASGYDSHSREGTYRFENDRRLTISTTYQREVDDYLYRLENGRIIFFAEPENPEELYGNDEKYQHRTDIPKKGMYLHSDAQPPLDHPSNDISSPCWFKYSIEWSGSPVFSAVFMRRSAETGPLYLPPIWKFDSLQDLRSSKVYAFAQFLSETSDESYNRYFDALDLTTEDFDGLQRGERGLSKQEIYDQCIVFQA